MLTQLIIEKIIKPRREDSHKGDNGKVLVVGGSKDYSGAPVLVGMAALRAGVDLVFLITPQYIYNSTSNYLPDLITRSYQGEYLNEKSLPLIKNINDAHTLNIGNGLSKNHKALETSRRIIKNWHGPVIIDADCLNKQILRDIPKETIITPHKTEFKQMFGTEVPKNMEKRIEIAEKHASEHNCVILLKGPDADIITNGKKTELNGTGNAGMTVGGTGDTLAGIIGALTAQKYNLFDAACLAAYINGSAGDLAFKKYGYSLLASDLIQEIPKVLINLNKK